MSGQRLIFGEAELCRHCRGKGCPACTDGIRLRDIGMGLVVGAESTDWPARAERWILGLASGTTFTAEDLTAAIGRPARPNSVGARLSACARMGWVKPVGYARAHRPERHASRMLRWVRV